MRHYPTCLTGAGSTLVYSWMDRRTGQYMVHDGDTVKLPRTIIGLPEAKQMIRRHCPRCVRLHGTFIVLVGQR